MRPPSLSKKRIVMKKWNLLIISLFGCLVLAAQTPEETAPLPTKLAELRPAIQVQHFPSPVLASQDVDQPGFYFWKHNTTIFSPASDIQIVEGGAYIYYNDQWNHRITYSKKEFAKLFGVPKGKMKAGEPYTLVENWRKDSRLYGGWAMWYLIGELPSGERVCGIGKLDTVGELYPK